MQIKIRRIHFLNPSLTFRPRFLISLFFTLADQSVAAADGAFTDL
jgi:hypothetical protein